MEIVAQIFDAGDTPHGALYRLLSAKLCTNPVRYTTPRRTVISSERLPSSGWIASFCPDLPVNFGVTLWRGTAQSAARAKPTYRATDMAAAASSSSTAQVRAPHARRARRRCTVARSEAEEARPPRGRGP